MERNKINFFIIIGILSLCFSANAVSIDCFENEKDPAAVRLFLSSVDSTQIVLNFQESYAAPHPKKHWGFNFESIQQSPSSRHLFPLGVYTGTATAVEGDEVYKVHGTLAIEEMGFWSFAGFDYQYRGSYVFIAPETTTITPVYCRTSSSAFGSKPDTK